MKNYKTIVLVAAVALVSTTACAKKQKATAMNETSFVEQTAAKTPVVQNTTATMADDDHDGAPIYFAFDSHSLSDVARAELNRVATVLKKSETATLRIEGHTDDRGTTEYNLALGERRADAARDYLKRLGVDPGRVRIVSYGEERPATAGESESAWARNRRDEFVVMR